jgi:hypothetical protein
MKSPIVIALREALCHPTLLDIFGQTLPYDRGFEPGQAPPQSRPERAVGLDTAVEPLGSFGELLHVIFPPGRPVAEKSPHLGIASPS